MRGCVGSSCARASKAPDAAKRFDAVEIRLTPADEPTIDPAASAHRHPRPDGAWPRPAIARAARRCRPRLLPRPTTRGCRAGDGDPARDDQVPAQPSDQCTARRHRSRRPRTRRASGSRSHDERQLFRRAPTASPRRPPTSARATDASPRSSRAWPSRDSATRSSRGCRGRRRVPSRSRLVRSGTASSQRRCSSRSSPQHSSPAEASNREQSFSGTWSVDRPRRRQFADADHRPGNEAHSPFRG